MATRKHLNAVESAVAACAHGLTEADGPLLELARTLARQMDAAGAEGPGTRLAGTYLTTVRTLNARLGGVRRPAPTTNLARLRAGRPRGGPSRRSQAG